ncbi:MAG: hypothetical protein P8N49_09545 [Opitutales bacterium]|nr:hypothetical protein [Opitutales bacterium]
MSPKLKDSLFICIVLVLAMSTYSCGNSDPQVVSESSRDNPADRKVTNLLMSSASNVSDLEDLLNDSDESISLVVEGAEPISERILPVNFKIIEAEEVLEIPTNTEAEVALQNLEESTIEHRRSIEELRKINANKDTTIASLSSINDELLAEVRRLKGMPAREAKIISSPAELLASEEVVDPGLHSEINNLKNSLFLKSNEIKDLRYRNDSLEARISSLENSPKTKIFLADPELNSQENRFSQNYERVSKGSFLGTCSINFDAVVTSYNGKSKEAFYTEFFVLNTNLDSILSAGNLNLSEFSALESFSELWARSRKNSFLYPKLQKNIRTLLLSEVEKGNGRRVRTDINGSASISGINKGNYFIIGTAALGKIGVTWNVPIVLDQGVNKVSLTLANASWSM